MCVISICVGSACHLRGSHDVLNMFEFLIEQYQVDATVSLEGNFCQERCTEGVVIKIDDEVITNVDKTKVFTLFAEKVLGGNFR
ncbi:MAG TPA: NAD(P)H-dependent oxidoreductase subunit E [Negativicutes bacterium]|nr:NAD(P)H-dependent oxidoreductase subunit E [Negativicutes bacterium]